MASRQTKARRASARRPRADRSTSRVRAGDSQRVQRAIQETINAGEIVAVGVLHVVRNTLVTALGGVRDVGAEIGSAAVAAVRGAIKAAYAVGADLGVVAREAIRGTV